MSSFIRRGTAAALLILSVGVGTGAQAGASSVGARSAPATSPSTAQLGAGWLGRQFKGSFIKSNGRPDPGSTAQAVLAFDASGVGGGKARAGIGWLKKHFESYVSPGGTDDAGALATVILAAQAMGVDPTHFGGKKAANNLVNRLIASQHTSGSDVGLFGSSDPTFDGAFRQGLSLMALAKQGLSGSAAVTAGVTWLKGQQCSDGGWESYRIDTSTPCPAPDPDDFSGPDTNSTTLAVEALVATGSRFPVNPLPFFKGSQNADGGFAFIGTSGQSSDPDSTGESIQALVALGQLHNAAFTEPGGATPVSELASFQLGCSSSKADRGSFMFPGISGPNLLATLQAVPGAAETAFPLGPRTLQPGLPKLKCAGS